MDNYRAAVCGYCPSEIVGNKSSSPSSGVVLGFAVSSGRWLSSDEQSYRRGAIAHRLGSGFPVLQPYFDDGYSCFALPVQKCCVRM